jgi:hypothetical protein
MEYILTFYLILKMNGCPNIGERTQQDIIGLAMRQNTIYNQNRMAGHDIGPPLIGGNPGYMNYNMPTQTSWGCGNQPCAAASRRILSSSITPLNITSSYDNSQLISLIMSNNDGLITLQWSPFSGFITTNDTFELIIGQGIPWGPSYPIEKSVVMVIKGVKMIGSMIIGPNVTSMTSTSFRIIFPQNQVANMNDTFSMNGGTIEWFVC